jgi:iron complex transport system permease protein
VRAGRVILRRGTASVRFDLRLLAAAAGLALVAFGALVASVALGEFDIPAADVVKTLVGAGDPSTDFIVLELRLPRAVVALLCGAALGLAGAVFQQVTLNPLASPDIVGVAGGASFAAIAVIVLGETSDAWSVPLAALAGALVSGALLYGLAWKRGIQGFRLVLVGIGLAAFMQAGISYVLTEGRIFEVAEAYLWMVGSVNGSGWKEVWPLVIALVVFVPVIVALGRQLDVLQLGDDVARGLGLNVERARLGLLAAAVVLVGIAVSAAGPVGFVAFLAPHLARRMSRATSGAGLLPLAAGAGAVLVLVADLVGRLAFAPTEIPVGIVTSVIAAPYFLLLLARANRVGATG